jgi:hypothetical protein
MMRVPVRAALLAAATISVWSFSGCRFSTTERPDSLWNVRVLIDIEQRSERQPDGREPYEFNHLNAVLTDGKGTALELPDVKVLMNGDPLTFVVGRGNYYDRHPRYTLPDDQKERLRADTDYRFSVVWTDRATHNAGTVRTPKPLVLSQITVPELHRAGREMEVAWRNLAEACDLIAFHGFEYPDAHGNLVQESGSVNADDVLRQTIGPGGSRSPTGRMAVPASYFETSGKRRVASFGVEVKRALETPVAATFAPGSRISVVRTLLFRTEIPAGS